MTDFMRNSPWLFFWLVVFVLFTIDSAIVNICNAYSAKKSKDVK